MGDPPEDQVEELRQIHPDLEATEEAGSTYILLKGLKLPDGCSPAQCDALLCPDGHLGYEARLLFAQQVSTKRPLNWHFSTTLLGRNWQAFSWRLGSNSLRLAQVLAILLDAMR
jgi:hypothetical protein